MPEDRRDLFVRHEAVAGTVTSVGYKQRTDLIGSHVVFQVGLPALTVTLLPAEWDALIDAARARAEAGALAAAGGKCAITGAPQSEVVLAVVPVFRFDLKEESLEEWSECVTVVGWMAVAAPIAAGACFRPSLLRFRLLPLLSGMLCVECGFCLLCPAANLACTPFAASAFSTSFSPPNPSLSPRPLVACSQAL